MCLFLSYCRERLTCSGEGDGILARCSCLQLLSILTDYILYKRFTKLCIYADTLKISPKPWLHIKYSMIVTPTVTDIFSLKTSLTGSRIGFFLAKLG